MSWKDDLVKALNELSSQPLNSEVIGILITGDRPGFAVLLPHVSKVNSHPVAWVGPGFLRLSRVNLDGYLFWCVFELSPERKFNEFFVEDILPGQIGKLEFPIHDSIDFMSL